MVRVRIAPSPTGVPHIGNTRTALFNYLFAKHNKGKFIVRIEDTDQARIVLGAEEAIYEILEWLGLKWDGEPYKQSEHLDEYKKHADILLEKGLAYKDGEAIRFKMSKEGETFWDDLIGKKHILFKNETQEDFVILKSDGFPTYNFANVVDDHLMEITDVIRGEEFISSTPKHIKLYKAFGWKQPNFAHLPVILGVDKTKLSKRHGAKSVLDLRKDGYLKEDLINFMGLLGWSGPKGARLLDRRGREREIFSMDEMIKLFDLKDVNTNSPIFDIKKLEWFNKEYLRMIDDMNLRNLLSDFYKDDKEVLDLIKSDKAIDLIASAKTRIKTLADFKLSAINVFPPEITPKQKELAQKLIKVYKPLEWKPAMISGATIAARDQLDAGTVDVYTVLTGKPSGLPFEKKIYAQGKSGTIDWLEKILSKL